uniref:Bestrophin homolog n=1 Tax=Eutreptiella gymnastica TaxID=73025 RepID=A0A6T1TW95_9EUGL
MGEWHRSRGIDSYEMVAVSQQLDGLAEVQGAVERLASTPLPYPYTLLLLRTAWLYVLLAPFALAAPLNWYTPLFNAIVAYTFFGLNEVARHMEAPFRSEPQCLALSAMCRVIEISVCEALGEAAPEPLVAEKFQLM